jgi:hypothetical protein
MHAAEQHSLPLLPLLVRLQHTAVRQWVADDRIAAVQGLATRALHALCVSGTRLVPAKALAPAVTALCSIATVLLEAGADPNHTWEQGGVGGFSLLMQVSTRPWPSMLSRLCRAAELDSHVPTANCSCRHARPARQSWHSY